MRPTLLVLAAVSVLCSSAHAQDRVRRRSFELDQVVFDAHDGTIFAAGPSWKAEFDADGVTYVPFLGSDAPRNYPVRFSIAEVRVGRRAVTLDSTPEVTRVGDQIRIDHGLVLETYDCRPDGMEQAFHVRHRARAGEVVVRLDVESDLVAVDGGEELRFDGALGGVSYGRAVAFDEAGRASAVERRYVDRSIELRVPDAFPLEGDGALTIDPLIATYSLSDTVIARFADVAFEKDFVQGGIYYSVYERLFSSSDTDVYATSYRPLGGVVSDPISIDITGDDYEMPRIAASDWSDRFLIVCTSSSDGGKRSVRGRMIFSEVDTGAPFQVNAIAGDCHSPDVGGVMDDPASLGFVVVYQRQGLVGRGDIYARHVDGDGVPLDDDIELEVDWVVDDRAPRISDTSGIPTVGVSQYNVAWERHTGGERRVMGATLLADGTPYLAPFFLTTEGDCHTPDVTPTSPHVLPVHFSYPFLVSYTRETQNSRGHVMVAVCDYSGVINTHDMTEKIDYGGGDERDAAVALVGDRYVLAYARRKTSTSYDFDARLATFGLTETGGSPDVALVERATTISQDSPLAQRGLSIASEYEAGLSSNKAFVVWTTSNPFQKYTTSVDGAYVSSLATDRPLGVQYCDAFGNSTGESGWIAAHGEHDTATSKVVIAEDLPPGQFAYFLASKTPGSVLYPGGSYGHLCLGGAIGRFNQTVQQVPPNGTTYLILDPSEIAQPAGPVAAVPGERWHFQCWHRDKVGQDTTSNFTNGIAIDFL